MGLPLIPLNNAAGFLQQIRVCHMNHHVADRFSVRYLFDLHIIELWRLPQGGGQDLGRACHYLLGKGNLHRAALKVGSGFPVDAVLPH